MPKLWLFLSRARDVLAVDRTPMVLILSGLIAFILGCMASDLRQDMVADVLCVSGVALCAVGYELLRLRAG